MQFVVILLGAAALMAQMPPVLNPKNIYSETTLGKMKPGIERYPSLIYIPHTRSNTVWVYDPAKRSSRSSP